MSHYNITRCWYTSIYLRIPFRENCSFLSVKSLVFHYFIWGLVGYNREMYLLSKDLSRSYLITIIIYQNNSQHFLLLNYDRKKKLGRPKLECIALHKSLLKCRSTVRRQMATRVSRPDGSQPRVPRTRSPLGSVAPLDEKRRKKTIQ